MGKDFCCVCGVCGVGLVVGCNVVWCGIGGGVVVVVGGEYHRIES